MDDDFGERVQRFYLALSGDSNQPKNFVQDDSELIDDGYESTDDTNQKTKPYDIIDEMISLESFILIPSSNQCNTNVVNKVNSDHEVYLEIVKDCRKKFINHLKSRYGDHIRILITTVRKKIAAKVAVNNDGSRLEPSHNQRHLNGLIELLGSWSNMITEIDSYQLPLDVTISIIEPLSKRIHEVALECYHSFKKDKDLDNFVSKLSRQDLKPDIESMININTIDFIATQISMMKDMFSKYQTFLKILLTQSISNLFSENNLTVSYYLSQEMKKNSDDPLDPMDHYQLLIPSSLQMEWKELDIQYIAIENGYMDTVILEVIQITEVVDIEQNAIVVRLFEDVFFLFHRVMERTGSMNSITCIMSLANKIYELLSIDPIITNAYTMEGSNGSNRSWTESRRNILSKILFDRVIYLKCNEQKQIQSIHWINIYFNRQEVSPIPAKQLFQDIDPGPGTVMQPVDKQSPGQKIENGQGQDDDNDDMIPSLDVLKMTLNDVAQETFANVNNWWKDFASPYIISEDTTATPSTQLLSPSLDYKTPPSNKSFLLSNPSNSSHNGRTPSETSSIVKSASLQNRFLQVLSTDSASNTPEHSYHDISLATPTPLRNSTHPETTLVSSLLKGVYNTYEQSMKAYQFGPSSNEEILTECDLFILLNTITMCIDNIQSLRESFQLLVTRTMLSDDLTIESSLQIIDQEFVQLEQTYQSLLDMEMDSYCRQVFHIFLEEPLIQWSKRSYTITGSDYDTISHDHTLYHILKDCFEVNSTSSNDRWIDPKKSSMTFLGAFQSILQYSSSSNTAANHKRIRKAFLSEEITSMNNVLSSRTYVHFLQNFIKLWSSFIIHQIIEVNQFTEWGALLLQQEVVELVDYFINLIDDPKDVIRIQNELEPIQLILTLLTLDQPNDIIHYIIPESFTSNEEDVKNILGRRIEFSKEVISRVKIKFQNNSSL